VGIEEVSGDSRHRRGTHEQLNCFAFQDYLTNPAICQALIINITLNIAGIVWQPF
jgi:hypothetical protein